MQAISSRQYHKTRVVITRTRESNRIVESRRCWLVHERGMKRVSPCPRRPAVGHKRRAANGENTNERRSMSKSVGEQYERLLTEAWALYDGDPGLRAWSGRCQLARWLRDISAKCCLPGVAELRLLDAVVCAMRTCDHECVAALLPGCDPDKSVGLMTRERRGPAAAAALTPVNECDADGGRLRAALAAVDEQCVGLEEFFRDVAAHTCDRGALLMRVTGDLLSEFRVFVDGVFGNRVSQIGAVLAREQMAARDRYAALECRVINRAQLAYLFVRDAIPEFNWSQYFADPLCYIRSVVPSRCPRSPDGVSEEPADDGDPDAAEDVQGKALLYQLNWLRSEIDRAECESHTLQEQHSGLTAELGAIDGRMADVKCQTADREAKMLAELDALRARSAQQVCVVDKLMETIHMAIQNSKSNPTKADDSR